MLAVTKISLIISAIALNSLNTQAALYDRGNGMIYDSSLNITWLQDANYAKASGRDSDGLMTWRESKTWAASLVYGGYSGWRLPSAGLIGDPSFSYNGSTDKGYNNTRSEIGHLYIELGNIAEYNSAGEWVWNTGYGFKHTTFVDAATSLNVSFLNVQGSHYWEKESWQPNLSGYAWKFNTGKGLQVEQDKISSAYTWLVHTGDVAAVPVPAAGWLMGSGLIALAGIARRRK